VTNFTSQPLYLQEMTPILIKYEALPSLDILEEMSLPFAGIRNPKLPARRPVTVLTTLSRLSFICLRCQNAWWWRTVILRLTKIIRSGITFVSLNFSLSRSYTTQSGWCVSPMWCGQLISLSHTHTDGKISSCNGPTVHVCCFMLARASTKTFVSRIHIR